MNLLSIKKILKGGENDSLAMDLKSFFYLIIIGYVGVKIVLGLLFKMYPEKYYTKNIIIQTNEPVNPFILKHNSKAIEKQNLYLIGPKTKKIVEKGLMPNMFNMEIMDLITVFVFSFVIFVFCFHSINQMVEGDRYLFNNFVVIGYIIGLAYPIFNSNLQTLLSSGQSEPAYNNNYLISFIGWFIIIISFTLFNDKIDLLDKVNYVCYAVIIGLIYYGIIKTKKTAINYDTTTEIYNAGTQCSNDVKGHLKSSYDILNVTIPMTAWIILLLFSYAPSNALMKLTYFFLFGILLGIFVSGVSFFGLEYVLTKIPEEICQGEDCMDKKLGFEEKINVKISSEKPSQTRKIFMTFFVIIVLTVLYMFYANV